MRQLEKPSKDVSKSAQRTNDNSPPIQRWVRMTVWSPWNGRLNWSLRSGRQTLR